jgi:hypothetical protein
MRPSVVILTLNAMLLAVPAASLASGLMFTLHGGGAVPQGEFGEWWNSAYVLGGSVEYPLGDRWAVGIDVAVAKGHHDHSSLFLVGPMDHLDVTSVAGLVRWMPGSLAKSFVPFVSVGAGSYQIDEDFTDDPAYYVPPDARQSALGLRGGAGFRWRVAPYMSFEISGDYHLVKTDPAKIYFDEVPLTALQAGLCFGGPNSEEGAGEFGW